MKPVATGTNTENGKQRALPPYVFAPAAFHNGYAAFVSQWINENAVAVERVIVNGGHCVVLAGVHRIYARKEDGHLVYEAIDQKTGKWEPCKGSFALFGDFGHWHQMLRDALRHRILPFVEHTRKKFDSIKDQWGRGHSFEEAIGAAIQMRIGVGFKSEVVGKKAKVLITIMARAIWADIVDKKITSLANAYFGLRFTMHEYNIVVTHEAVLRQIAAESPKILPVLGLYLRLWVCQGEIRGSLSEEVFVDLVAKAKQKLHECGLSKAGWRYLLGSSITTVRVFAKQFWLIEGNARERDPEIDIPPKGWDIKESPACLKINLLAAAQNRSPHAFDKWLIHEARRLGLKLKDPSAFRFVRLASLEASVARKEERLNAFIRHDLPLCQDWLVGSVHQGGGFGGYGALTNTPLTIVPKNATWASIMRAQRAWHLDTEGRRIAYEAAMAEADEAARKEAEARLVAFKALEWESLVNVTDLDGVVATPLTTGASLLQEANEMSHCVDSYAPDCLTGFSRLFHLAGPGESATIELAHKGKHWVVAQLYGYDNNEASASMWRAGAVLAKLYSVAQRSVKRAA